jgi:hypothetical protein
MTIRIGTYTLYENIEMSVNEYYGHGLDQEFEKVHRTLSYTKDYGQLNGFSLDEVSNRYKKDIRIKDLKNAFFVTTKAKYKGKFFVVEPYHGDEIHLHLATKDLELGKKLNFYELHDGIGKPYYLGEIKISEVEEIWEERQKSIYDVPIPENIEVIKIIKTAS